MRIEAFSKALVFFNMLDVFQIMDKNTVEALELHLSDLFLCQAALDACDTALKTNPTDTQLIIEQAAASLTSSATTKIQSISIKTTDLVQSFKNVDE